MRRIMAPDLTAFRRVDALAPQGRLTMLPPHAVESRCVGVDRCTAPRGGVVSQGTLRVADGSMKGTDMVKVFGIRS